jgi:serine/threonine protein phosphatase PrpC
VVVGVYDGHAGHECADTLRFELPHYVARQLAHQNTSDALSAAFVSMDADLRRVAESKRLVKHDPKRVLPAIAYPLPPSY